MNEEIVIEVCVGVGMDQIFPETIKIIVDEQGTPILKDPNEERNHEEYYYYGF